MLSMGSHPLFRAMFNFANSKKKSPEGFCGSSPTPLPSLKSDPYVPFPNRKTICALPPAAAKKLGHKNSIRALLLGKWGHQWEDVTNQKKAWQVGFIWAL